MGFFYTDRPPERPSKLGRLIPGWLKELWASIIETLTIIRVVFAILLPILAVMFGFLLLLGVLVILLGTCSSGTLS